MLQTVDYPRFLSSAILTLSTRGALPRRGEATAIDYERTTTKRSLGRVGRSTRRRRVPTARTTAASGARPADSCSDDPAEAGAGPEAPSFDKLARAGRRARP